MTSPLTKRLPAALLCCLALAAIPSQAVAKSGSGTFQITGAGFGHGIGMSQYGAMGYAEHGWNVQAILGHYFAGTTLGQVSNSTVTVLLSEGSAVFKGATAAAGKTLSASTTYGVVPSGSRLSLISAGRTIATVRAPLTVTGPNLDVTGEGRYAGSLKFYPAGGQVLTVNAVDLEDYVKGVVTEEMPSSWPEAALEAQAVAARTYALAIPAVGPDYDVYADNRSQVYGGIGAETSAGNLAEADTRGQVVEDAGRVVPTYFFSSSGGHTESIQDVWVGTSPEPYLVGESDPYDDSGGNPYYRWTDTLSLSTAAKELAGLFKGSLEGIKIDQHGTSPRIVSAQVIGTKGSSTVAGETLQEDLGTMSTWMAFTTVTARGKVSSGSGSGSSSGGSSSGSSGGSSSGGSGSSSSGGAGLGGSAVRSASARGTASVRGTASASRPARLSVTGSVFPATRGSVVLIERRLSSGRWVRAGVARTGSDGAYSALVSVAGVYRAVFHGAAAPPVTLG